MGCIFYGRKRTEVQNVSVGTQKEAIRLHIEEKWTYRQITDHFHIQDTDRVKKWMQQYRKLGEFGLLDQREKRNEYVDSGRQLQALKRENELLKKCLPIWREGKQKRDMRSSSK
ncbi:helix-turn-helix domain-containing protein [Saccharibacillus sacchari]|uniref:helix-turn-helix domain-containing protein n=1 Tax=Saccharibacillus sacchari TaxID=456493 RepID=UPI003CCA46F1